MRLGPRRAIPHAAVAQQQLVPMSAQAVLSPLSLARASRRRWRGSLQPATRRRRTRDEAGRTRPEPELGIQHCAFERCGASRGFDARGAQGPLCRWDVSSLESRQTVFPDEQQPVFRPVAAAQSRIEPSGNEGVALLGLVQSATTLAGIELPPAPPRRTATVSVRRVTKRSW